MTDTGTGEINSATVVLNARKGAFITEENIGDGGIPATPILAEFDKDEIKYITEAKRYQYEKKLSSMENWNKVSPKAKTILTSVGWQYGLDSKQFKSLWKSKMSRKDMAKKLREFGGLEFSERRELEAKHVEPSEETAYMEQWNKEDNIFV